MERRDSAEAKHLNALDVGRGLAIVAVIYGHALAPWVMTAGANFNEAAFLQWKFGASFLMPFFFFLSGVGWREQKPLSDTVRQAVTLVLIALMASAIYDFARLAVSIAGLAPALGGERVTLNGYVTGVARMILIGDYYSLSPLWFIVTLAMVRMLAAIVVRLSPAGSFALTFLAVGLSAAACGFDWRNFYQIKPFGAAFLFFLGGRIARGSFHALSGNLVAALASTLIGGAVVLATFHLNDGCRWDAFAQCGLPWLDGRFGVALIHGQIGNIPMFTITALAGVAFASGLAILFARFGGAVGRRLDAWGGNSLNLLIVNALCLHVGNVFVDRWIAPAVAAHNILFYVALFCLALVANLIGARLLERPLRTLHRAALTTARLITDTLTAAPAGLAWVRRGVRVSQHND